MDEPQRSKLTAIFVQGAFGWGIGTAILFLALTWLFRDRDLSFSEVIRAAVVFPLCGMGHGYWCWRSKGSSG